MKTPAPFADTHPKRQAIRRFYHEDETTCVIQLLQRFETTEDRQIQIQEKARQLVTAIRENNENHGGLDAFLQEFKLSSREGVALMCLAEALLRVPDAATADELIQDKLSNKDWASHLGESDSFFVNASTWGLMLTGKVISLDKSVAHNMGEYLGKLVARSGEPVIRSAVRQAMKIMGKQFVLAENIQQGIKTARDKEAKGYCYSYDMLGEAARTAGDAECYMAAYEAAISAIGNNDRFKNPFHSAGISVKLSALHPRYEYQQEQRILGELLPRLQKLCVLARSFNIGLTIDAEESERLEPSLTLLQALFEDQALHHWDGLGFVVQAYQKRAPAVIDWIEALSLKHRRRVMIRLVKGAYWDTEIKQAQIEGYPSYPVFTRKISTDLSYLVCAQKLLANPEAFYPLFATHNAHTVASILNFAGDRKDYEFQCLHGMGEILYDQVVGKHGVNCRIYAPVGPHKDLLAYLIRRLLENGANSSFVNRLVDKELPIGQIINDPVDTIRALDMKSHPDIPIPSKLYPDRENSRGFNINDESALRPFLENAAKFHTANLMATPLVSSPPTPSLSIGVEAACFNPSTGKTIGKVINATEEQADTSVKQAKKHQPEWDDLGGKSRAEILRRAAHLYEKNRDTLLWLCMAEGGKTINDAVAELREAVDFLRYYALQAEKKFDQPKILNGPTGEHNQLALHGRGAFVCISPWNFPLAIFTGQVSAALAAGNAVLAKPAEQTPIIAYHAVQLLHQAGIPLEILQLLPGDGAVIGAALANHPDIDGVAFTGSTETAKIIQKSIAAKPGPIVPLIAETGGINAMMVDSTALPEQVIQDAVSSAFRSAGQRCSALRALYVQADVYDQILEMLAGAMAELKVGDTAEIDTDIGPIIDREARENLSKHIEYCQSRGMNVIHGPAIKGEACGYFFSPVIVEIDGIYDLKHEIFGPILHICRYRAKDLDAIVDNINATGYGLTFGVHSRVQSTIDRITQRIKVGNIYINRNTIGAVVGVQPFGGQGLSGTGPKAGGPHYLNQFAIERATSIDTTAAGGNTSLLSLETL